MEWLHFRLFLLVQEKPPWFHPNTIGKPRVVWPTFVSFPRAHTFQGDGLGMVYHHASATWDELSPKERERAMGSKLTLLITLR